MWRSGALSRISGTYAEAAQQPFDKFLRNSPDVKNRSITEFFTGHPPRANEFLLAFKQSGKLVAMVQTS
jgi:hypothetical protein